MLITKMSDGENPSNPDVPTAETPDPRLKLEPVCNRECEKRAHRYNELSDDFCQRFRIERYCSLFSSFAGIVLMLICTIFAIRNTELKIGDLTSLSLGVVGSGGFIAVGIALLFKFMDKADENVKELL